MCTGAHVDLQTQARELAGGEPLCVGVSEHVVMALSVTHIRKMCPRVFLECVCEVYVCSSVWL